MNIVILGSSGMIGSAVTQYLTNADYQVVEVNRTGISITGKNEAHKFDAISDSLDELLIGFPPETVVINLIGLIRHKISLNSKESKKEAELINTTFPVNLVRKSKELGINVIQIATDCIFSGSKGLYSEDAKPDPVDVYGETKASGEITESNLLTLRVSIVGREVHDHIELLDWVISQKRKSEVNGYTNHYWNGITSLHYAKIIEGILRNKILTKGTYHLVPRDRVSKFELIKMIAELSGRIDLSITEMASENAIDRTLTTNYGEINREFWLSAGYEATPTIRIMLEEYFEWIKLIDQGE